MDRFKVYEINKAERDVRIGTSDTTKCFEKDKRWIHYRQLPSTCESLCQRVGETVEIGTREQFEAEIEDEKKPLFQRIAKQSAIIRDNEHVIDQQHDHIRQIETRLEDDRTALWFQMLRIIDEASASWGSIFQLTQSAADKPDDSRRVVKRYRIEGTLSKDDFIALDNGGKFTIKDDEEYLNAKYHNHRARVTLEILDKPEPTLAECWNLIRNVSDDNPSQEEIAAQQRCDKAVASEQDLYPIWEQWEAEDDKHDLPPYVFAALDAFITEQSQCGH
jgi:hypothetical protein